MAAFNDSLLNGNKAQQCELSVNGGYRFFQTNTLIGLNKDSVNYSAQYRVSCGICQGNRYVNYIIPMRILMNVNSCSANGMLLFHACASYMHSFVVVTWAGVIYLIMIP